MVATAAAAFVVLAGVAVLAGAPCVPSADRAPDP
jgi:hypothetical protein